MGRRLLAAAAAAVLLAVCLAGAPLASGQTVAGGSQAAQGGSSQAAPKPQAAQPAPAQAKPQEQAKPAQAASTTPAATGAPSAADQKAGNKTQSTGAVGPANAVPPQAEIDKLKEASRAAEDEAQRKALVARTAAEPDCSVPRKLSSCGDNEKLLCFGLGQCVEVGMRCDGKMRSSLFACRCPANRRGKQCELDAKTRHVFNCDLENKCGGRGRCVALRTKRTALGWDVVHGCECDEGFGGTGCHLRVGVAVGETPNGELVRAVPSNGGYFAFRELAAKVSARRR